MTTQRPPTLFNSPNRFDELQRLSGDDNPSPASGLHTAANSESATQPRSHKPPPIYVYDVTNYRAMTQYLTEFLEEEQYYCKALPNETVKINVTTSDSFWSLIKRLQDDKIVHPTYQIREERAYRVVIRHPHHSIPPHEFQTELESLDIKFETFSTSVTE